MPESGTRFEKNMFKRRAAALFMAAAAVLTCIVFTGSSESVSAATTISDATTKSLEDQLAKIESEQKDIAQQIKKIQGNQSSAYVDKAYYDKQLTLALSRLDTCNSLIEEYDILSAKLTFDIIDKEAEISEQSAKFRDRVRLVYEDGDASYLEMLLGSEDLFDFLSRVERIGTMIEYNTNLMKELRNKKTELANAKAEAENVKARQETLKADALTDKAEYESLAEQNASYLTQLAKDEVAYAAQQQKYAVEEEKINKELEEYIKEQQAKLNAAYVGGEFIWPVDISFSYISSYYGWRTLYGVKDFHLGIDIPASKNSNVYASNSGTVIKAELHYSYGNYIVIDHGGGKSTLYAHNNKLLVSVGDKVKQGDVIALVGTTGNSTGCHCHFEVRIDGVRQNPLDYVTAPK